MMDLIWVVSPTCLVIKIVCALCVVGVGWIVGQGKTDGVVIMHPTYSACCMWVLTLYIMVV